MFYFFLSLTFLFSIPLLWFVISKLIGSKIDNPEYRRKTTSFICCFLMSVLITSAIFVIDSRKPPFETYRIADTITKTEKLSEKTTKITEIQIIEKRKRDKISGSWDMNSVPKYEEEIKERIEFSEGENK